jgi:hypothetical protein
MDLLDRNGIDVIDATTAIDLDCNQVRFTEQVQVLHHEKAVLSQDLGQLTGGPRPVAQQIEHAPPMRVRESFPDAVKIIV